MKEKYENLEKAVFFVLLCVLLILIPVLLKAGAANSDIIDKKMQIFSTKKTDNSPKAKGCSGSKYLPVIERSSRKLSGLNSKRNIFKLHVSKKNAETMSGDNSELLVSEIGLKPLGVEYRGKVFFKDDDEMIAQVNVNKKSYLVKKGTRFSGYKVSALNGKYLKLKDKKGKILKIEYRQKAYTDELVAKIKELTSEHTKTVSKNDTFLEYKVLDINEDSVLLSLKGQHLRLEKGMVHK